MASRRVGRGSGPCHRGTVWLRRRVATVDLDVPGGLARLVPALRPDPGGCWADLLLGRPVAGAQLRRARRVVGADDVGRRPGGVVEGRAEPGVRVHRRALPRSVGLRRSVTHRRDDSGAQASRVVSAYARIIPEQFTVKAQESLFSTRLHVCCHVTVCVQMAATMEAATLPV